MKMKEILMHLCNSAVNVIYPIIKYLWVVQSCLIFVSFFLINKLFFKNR